MKKILIIGVLAAMFHASARADFVMGPFVGVNTTNASTGSSVYVTGNYFSTTNRTGFEAGVTSQYDINDWLSAAPELAYVQKGANVNYRGFGSATYLLEYAEFRARAKMLLPWEPLKSWNMFATVGPTVGFLTNSSTVLAANGVSSPASMRSVTSVEFGARVGVGLDYFSVDERAISLSVIYAHSFAGVVCDSVAYDWKNYALSLDLGVLFSM